jgi:hypothetical protein
MFFREESSKIIWLENWHIICVFLIMMEYSMLKNNSVAMGKLHIHCLYRQQTDINTHVVVKYGYCYRSENCPVVECKFNYRQFPKKPKLLLEVDRNRK